MFLQRGGRIYEQMYYPHAESYCRNRAGLPEGYLEAFANIYSTFMTALNKKKSGESLLEADWDFPSIEEGIQGVKLIDRCVESSQKGAVWIDF